MILGIFCLLVSAITSIGRTSEATEIRQSARDLGALIDSGEDHAEQMATIQAVGEAHAFAGNATGGNLGYYFVVDENYNYIVYASAKSMSKLVEGQTTELVGVLREHTSTIRNAAIDWMVSFNPDTDINARNFRSYFGGVYLDTTANATELTTGLNIVIRITLVAGLILILGGVLLLVFSKKTA